MALEPQYTTTLLTSLANTIQFHFEQKNFKMKLAFTTIAIFLGTIAAAAAAASEEDAPHQLEAQQCGPCCEGPCAGGCCYNYETCCTKMFRKDILELEANKQSNLQ